MDIKMLPVSELLDDLSASLIDAGVCVDALRQDITEYSGGSIQGRLDVNIKIAAVISSELKRRENEKVHRQGA